MSYPGFPQPGGQPPQLLRCPRCSCVLPVTAAYCRQCGTPLANRGVAPAPQLPGRPQEAPGAPKQPMVRPGHPYHLGPNPLTQDQLTQNQLTQYRDPVQPVPPRPPRRRHAPIDGSRPRVAPLSARLAASALDQGVVLALVGAAITLAVSRDTGWLPVTLLVAAALFTIMVVLMLGTTGRTPGKWLFGLRTVSVAPDAGGGPAAPGVRRAVVRTIVLAGLNVVLLLGAWSVLFDRRGRRRGWHDKLGRTVVLEVRHGHDPLRVVAAEDDGDQEEDPRAFGRVPVLASGLQMTPAVPEDPPIAAERPAARADAIITEVPGARRRAGVAPAVRKTAASPVPAPPSVVIRPRAAAPAPEPQRQTPVASAPTRRWSLVFDDGTTIAVTGMGLVGRDPAPSGDEVVTHLRPLGNDASTISKTHLAFGLDHDALWVADRHSTNGSALEIDGVRTPLTPGERTCTPAGAVVHLGARRFEVRQ